MERDHEGAVRGFIHLGAAWYRETSLRGAQYRDEVMLGMYHPDGGTSGEFAIRWVELGGKAVPHLEAFDDSWSVLSMFGDVLKALGEHDSENISPEAICAILTGHGFKDMTDREGPYKAGERR